MKLQTVVILLSLWLCYGCDSNRDLKDLDNDQINEILGAFDSEDPVFVNKDVKFDSILTLAGQRIVENKTERIKCKLFYFGPHVRGYFNLADQDDKNLQVFGKMTDGQLALKSVTKINMVESDGYIILDPNYEGIWSNGNVNFTIGSISLKRQKTDYTELTKW